MKVALTRIDYRRWERGEIGNWLMAAAILPLQDPELSDVKWMPGMIDYHDVAVCRNRAQLSAKQGNCDVLVMADQDMLPNRQFLAVALKTIRSANLAAVVGSPACGRRPERHVNVSVKHERLGAVRVSRTLAATKRGVEKVYCMGAGVIAIGMRAFDMVRPPYFMHLYNEDHTLITTTEDMYFTGRLTDAGGDVLCAWDCWSGHAKEEEIGKPEGGDA